MLNIRRSRKSRRLAWSREDAKQLFRANKSCTLLYDLKTATAIGSEP